MKRDVKKYLVTWWDTAEIDNPRESCRIVWAKDPASAIAKMYLDKSTFNVYELDEDSKLIFSKTYTVSQ